MQSVGTLRISIKQKEKPQKRKAPLEALRKKIRKSN